MTEISCLTQVIKELELAYKENQDRIYNDSAFHPILLDFASLLDLRPLRKDIKDIVNFCKNKIHM